MGALDTSESYAIEYYGDNHILKRHPRIITTTTINSDNTTTSSNSINTSTTNNTTNNTNTDKIDDSNSKSSVSYINKNIFEYIKDHTSIPYSGDDLYEMNVYDEYNKKISFTPSSSSASASSLGDRGHNSDPFLSSDPESTSQIPVLHELIKGSMMFGYISYEARHESTYILQHSSTQPIYEDTSGDTNTNLHMGQLYNMSCTHDIQYNKYKDSITNTYKHNKISLDSVPISVFLVPSRYIVCDHTNNNLYVIDIHDEKENDMRGNRSADHVSTSQTDDDYTTTLSPQFYELIDRVKASLSDFLIQQQQEHIHDTLTQIHTHVHNNSSNIQLNSNLNDEDGARQYDGILESSLNQQQYHSSIERCLDHISNGDSYELCLTMKFTGPCPSHTPYTTTTTPTTTTATTATTVYDSSNDTASSNNNINSKGSIVDGMYPLSLYKALRRKNTAAYSSYIRYYPTIYNTSRNTPISGSGQGENTGLGHLTSADGSGVGESEVGFTVCCSSPERYLKITPVLYYIVYLVYVLTLCCVCYCCRRVYS